MYPTSSQEVLLSKTFGCVRVIWNACVESFNSYDKGLNPSPKIPCKSDLISNKPWLNEVSAATLQQKQRDFIEFSKQYFNKSRKKRKSTDQDLKVRMITSLLGFRHKSLS